MNCKVMAAVAAAAMVLAAAPAAHAQPGYPTHPVRVVVPFSPGGVVDVMGRLLANKLTQETGVSFYIDNIGGGGGTIGTRVAATAAGDGYTILVTSSSFLTNPILKAKVPYDPIKDFTPVITAAASPNVIVVNTKEPARSLKDLVESIRHAPGKYSFSSAGIGTTPHLSGELFKQSTGIDLVHAPFTSAGPALQSTIGGHTQIAFSGLPPAVPLIKNGELRALAITSSKRLPALPDVPTLAEAGFPGQEAETLLFVLVPSGTPASVVDSLGATLRKIVDMADVQKQFDNLGFSPLGLTPEESSLRIREEQKKWGKVIQGAKLRVAE